jgi:hypothetical protein
LLFLFSQLTFLHLELQHEDLNAIEDVASEPAIDLVNSIILKEVQRHDLGAQIELEQ